MNIDRVAKGMTDANGPRGWRGPSGAAFTARVMAPIEGRPSPGFTARVMQGVDAPAARTAGRSISSGLRPALMLIPAALALGAGAFLLLRGTVHMPALPGAPVLATNGGPRVIETPELHTPTPTPRIVRASLHAQIAEPAVPPVAPAPPIYMIAALAGPEDIAIKDIEPAACTIPALAGPAPLKVADLPANGGGSQKDIKEQP